MRVTVDMENLQSIIEEAAKVNTEEAVNQAIRDVVREKVDTILHDSLEMTVNARIEKYVDEYLTTTKIAIGNSWSSEGVQEFTIEEYIRKLVQESFQDGKFLVRKTNAYNSSYTEEKTFQEYLDEKLNADALIKPQIDKMVKMVHDKLNRQIKDTFDESMRNMLSDAVFAVVTSSDAYRRISENIKLLGN